MSKELICRECLHVGLPRKVKRGSGKTELIMWAVVLIPGPFYSVWRRTGKQKRCAVCGSDMLSSTETAIGKRLLDIAEKQVSGELQVDRTLMQKVTKPDAKTVSVFARQVDEVMRAETGMSLEKGMGASPAREKTAPPQAVEEHEKPLTQRPRGATNEQEPEDW